MYVCEKIHLYACFFYALSTSVNVLGMEKRALRAASLGPDRDTISGWFVGYEIEKYPTWVIGDFEPTQRNETVFNQVVYVCIKQWASPQLPSQI